MPYSVGRCLIFTLTFISIFLLHFLNLCGQPQLKAVSQKSTRMNTSGRGQSEMGKFDPSISSLSTIQPSETSFSESDVTPSSAWGCRTTHFLTFIYLLCFLLCFSLGILLVVQYSRGGLPLWEVFLPVDNQGRISTVNTTSGLPLWQLFFPVNQD